MSDVRIITISDVNFRTYLEKEATTLSGEEGKVESEIVIFERKKVWQTVAGYRENNIKQIEEDTGTLIQKDKLDNGQFNVLVKGNDLHQVKLASIILKTMTSSISQDLTHFISLPLRDIPNWDLFYRKSRNILPSATFHEIFKPAKRLHFTVSVHTLNVDKVNNVLEILDRGLQHAKPITVHLKGLQIIKGSPQECKVLACTPTKHKELDSMFRPILMELVRCGLASNLSVLWHCTLFNTRGSTVDSFNAQKLLYELGRFDFGEMTINEVHLSKFVKSDEDYYEAEAVFRLEE